MKPNYADRRIFPPFRAGIALAVALLAVLLSCASLLFTLALAEKPAQRTVAPADVSPIFGVAIPAGYRQWELIAPAEEAAPLDELRAVVGNKTALDALRDGKLPFPDGTVLVKRAWKRVQSPEFSSATVPGAATTVQVMVKNSKKYASTGDGDSAGS